MSTVRVYKVASILDITSQDVIARLRRDHGIDVKSASSSIEEVVARQFIERVAKELGISISSKDPLSKTLSNLRSKLRSVKLQLQNRLKLKNLPAVHFHRHDS